MVVYVENAFLGCSGHWKKTGSKAEQRHRIQVSFYIHDLHPQLENYTFWKEHHILYLL